MNSAVVQEARRDNATHVEISAQRVRFDTGLWRIIFFDSETLTQHVGRKKEEIAIAALAAEVESVHGFFVLAREETAGR